MQRVLYLLLLVSVVACTPSPDITDVKSTPNPVPETASESVVEPTSTSRSERPAADLVSVTVTGEAGRYTFAATIKSTETGCDQYADWWEVADAQTGKLLYRRILAHSHVDEQPFTRSGGPVPIQPDQAVIVRAHMGGLQSHYGGQVLGGTVDAGFEPVVDSLPSLEQVEPLPMGCAF